MSAPTTLVRAIGPRGRHRRVPEPTPSSPAQLSLPWSLFLALPAGACLAAAFPPVGLWYLAPVALALLTFVVRGRTVRQGAVLGFVAGLGLFVPLLWWLHVVGPDAWLVLAAFQSLYLAGLGAGLAIVVRLPGWPLWTAALWVSEEFVRDRIPFGGFPWGRVAFSQGNTPFTGFAALAGAPLVTFAVVGFGALLCAVAVAVVRRKFVLAAVALVSAVLVPLAGVAVPRPVAGKQVTAAVIQGNVPRLGLDYLGQRSAVLHNHVNETLRLAAQVDAGTTPRPDFVIWPENASDIDPFQDPAAGDLIGQAVDAIGVPTLVGAVLQGPGPNHVSNDGIVWNPGSGPGARYVKRHPVPFGEYLPFRSVLERYIKRFTLIPKDFISGKKIGVLQLGSTTIGDVICFEVAYDNIVRDAVTHGGQVIVVQTNNATYGRTGETEQQLAMSQLRAVEHGRAVLIAATSGVSAVIAPDGHVMARTQEFTAASLVEQIPLRTSLTVADRLGAAPEWSLAVLGMLAVVTGVAVARRQRTEAAE